jgi:hypothetical protein
LHFQTILLIRCANYEEADSAGNCVAAGIRPLSPLPQTVVAAKEARAIPDEEGELLTDRDSQIAPGSKDADKSLFADLATEADIREDILDHRIVDQREASDEELVKEELEEVLDEDLSGEDTRSDQVSDGDGGDSNGEGSGAEGKDSEEADEDESRSDEGKQGRDSNGESSGAEVD